MLLLLGLLEGDTNGDGKITKQEARIYAAQRK
jgi:hypothetical protein